MSSYEDIMQKCQRMFLLMDIPAENSGDQSDENWPRSGTLEFKNVQLRYRPNTDIVLNDLSFKVDHGNKVGIVGRTGAGKSTICLAISRIVELFKGQIEIDGVDISKIKLDNLRKNITVIPQDPCLFSSSVKFNLDPSETLPDHQLQELLKKAGINKQLDMEIEENGKNLSSGEKQLICICRAILKKNKLVILDEATANIDIITEEKIQSLINQNFADCTVITIAHRLKTIINSDKVLVLSKGQSIEYDAPAILRKNPTSEFTKLLSKLEQK